MESVMVTLRIKKILTLTMFKEGEIFAQGKDTQFSSVAQSCPTLCHPMNRSTPGLPVHHKPLESTQTHAHRVGDAIQPLGQIKKRQEILNPTSKYLKKLTQFFSYKISFESYLVVLINTRKKIKLRAGWVYLKLFLLYCSFIYK